ncbi:MAG: hypothetical protein ACPIOQ_58885, partial [Promethearchaeia archaeon]
ARPDSGACIRGALHCPGLPRAATAPGWAAEKAAAPAGTSASSARMAEPDDAVDSIAASTFPGRS